MSGDCKCCSMLKRVRKFIVRKDDDSYNSLLELCHKSKNMYNFALHQLLYVFKANYPCKNETPEKNLSFLGDDFRKAVRKHVIDSVGEDGKSTSRTFYDLSEFDFYTVCKNIHQFDYYNLPVNSSRSVIKLAYDNVKSYYASLKKYVNDGNGMTGYPEFPRYLKRDEGVEMVCFRPKFGKKDGSIIVGRDGIDSVIISKAYDSVDGNHKVKQIRIVPHKNLNYISVELVYEKLKKKIEYPNEGHSMGIHIGIKNICAIATTDGDAFLVKGKKLIGINEFANSRISKLHSLYGHSGIKTGKKRKQLLLKRENKLDFELHRISKVIVEYAVSRGIRNIFIGHDNGYNHGLSDTEDKKSKFIQLPYNKLISKIVYKAEEAGIIAEIVNESFQPGDYNSNESVTSCGKLINSDINAALKILKSGMKSNTAISCKRAFNPWTMELR